MRNLFLKNSIPHGLIHLAYSFGLFSICRNYKGGSDEDDDEDDIEDDGEDGYMEQTHDYDPDEFPDDDGELMDADMEIDSIIRVDTSRIR